jgi:hypothetical protein
MQCGMISLQVTVQVKPTLVSDNILQQIDEIEHTNIRDAVSQTALSNQLHPEKWHLVQRSCKLLSACDLQFPILADTLCMLISH